MSRRSSGSSLPPGAGEASEGAPPSTAPPTLGDLTPPAVDSSETHLTEETAATPAVPAGAQPAQEALTVPMLRPVGTPPKADPNEPAESPATVPLTAPVTLTPESSYELDPAPGEDPMQDPPPGAVASDLPVGSRLGKRYAIRRLLGRGGMGTVYLAHDVVLGAEVALKLIHRVHQGEESLSALRAEVQLAQRVTHRNICRTYDLEEIDGQFVVKMEPIEGQTLAERLRRQSPLPIEEALGVVREIAAGLEAAHAQGVIHCDLKPQNVFIESASDRVVLMDFGIARSVVRRATTTDRTQWGTPEYMAPEQITGGEAEPASDLYSLGCLFYELLTGKPPYVGKTSLQIALSHLHGPVSDPRAARPDVPAWLAAVVQRLLAKNVTDRFASAQDLLVALAGPATDSPAQTPRRWRRRDLAVLALAPALVLGLAGRALMHNPGWQPMVVERQPRYFENADSPAISPDGRWLAYISNRDSSWRVYLEPIAGGSARALTPQDNFYYNPHWTRDSKYLLANSWDWHLVRIAIDSGALETIASGVSVSEDCGGQLVIGEVGNDCGESCTSRIVVYDDGRLTAPFDARRAARSVARELVRLPRPTLLWGMRCDPTGRDLVYAAATGEHPGITIPRADLYLVPVAGGPVRQLTADRRQNVSPFFHPDGRRIFFASSRSGISQLWELPLDGGQPLQITNDGPVLSADISPDGRRLIYDHDSTICTLFAYPQSRSRRRLSPSEFDLSQPAPTGDGREIVVRMLRQSEARTYAVALSLSDGSERILAEAESIALTPDGLHLLYGVLDGTHSLLYRRPLASSPHDPPRQLARLPGRIYEIYADPQFAYVNVGNGVEPTHWRIPLEGGAPEMIEQPAEAKIIPSPTGGWKLVNLGHDQEAKGQHWRVVAPGRPLDAPEAHVILGLEPVWTTDGQGVLFWNGHEVRQYVLADGSERTLTLMLDHPRGMALGRDGATLYVAEFLGHVTRKMVMNFGDRPRP
ncbi:MAG TPA: protein kinase [Polyangia bacterium]|nr:protein kinase [Polyangia bacterium]